MKQFNVIVLDGGKQVKDEKSQKTFDVIMVRSKVYPYRAMGINFWHLLPGAKHKAEVLFDDKVKII